MKTLLSALALASAVIAGNVTFNGSNRFLFDVEGNHISAYALKIYCELEDPRTGSSTNSG